MKRRTFWLAMLGLVLAALVGVVAVSAAPSRQEAPPNLGAEYVGSQVCRACHNSGDARLWDAWRDTIHALTVEPALPASILGDLAAVDQLTITWPDGSTRPITADDITYVIHGRHIQQYISVLPRADGTDGWFVLPVVWNIPQQAGQTGAWTPFHSDDWTDPARDWRVACAACHTTGLTAERLAGTIRPQTVADFNPRRRGAVELGIGCEACHGPGGDHAGGRNPMVSTPDAQVCGQCHAQGHDGEHAFPLNYEPGLSLDETGFVLTPQDDPDVWWPTGHSRVVANQYAEWLTSGHANALNSVLNSPEARDACLRCHTSGVDTTDPTPERAVWLAEASSGVTCAACHNPHPAESQPRFFDLEGTPLGALDPLKPPDVLARPAHPSVGSPLWQGGAPLNFPYLLQLDSYTLCIRCHNSRTPGGGTLLVGGTLHYPVQEMFEGWQVVEGVPGIPSAHVEAEDGPRCVTCHMVGTVQIGPFAQGGSHTFRPVLPGEAAPAQPDSCSACHYAVVTRQDVQNLIDDTQQTTLARLQAARALTGADTAAWVETALQFLEGDASLGVHNFAYTDALLDAVEVELGLVPAAAPTPSTGPFLGDVNDAQP